MLGTLERDSNTVEPMDDFSESDRWLCAQLALKMAALLPDDPEQAEYVLESLNQIYRVMRDHEVRPRPAGLDG